MSVAGAGWGKMIPPPESKLEFLGNDAIEKMAKDYVFDEVLDIGCGAGLHADYFRSQGKRVVTLDAGQHYDFKPDYLGNYEHVNFGRQFEAMWISHVVEHVLDVQSFLRKVYADLAPGGLLCISVPPMKHDIVSGHINLFNPGLLLFRMVSAGFDCAEAAVKVYGYNISVILRKSERQAPIGEWRLGPLAPYFPFPIDPAGFDGRVLECNWDRSETRSAAPAVAPEPEVAA